MNALGQLPSRRGDHVAAVPAQTLRAPEAVVLFALGLFARLPLVFAYPAVHGGDSVLRLARSDELLIGIWLPLPQLVVYLTRAVAPDPLWTRLAFSLLGAATPLSLAALLAATAGPAPARIAGALAALHPLLVYYSTVPYQEVLALPLLLAGYLALLRGASGRASLLLGLACLSRYEAWIAAALAGFARRERPARAAALFGWAPFLWFVACRGLGPAGGYVLDLDAGAGWLRRLGFLLAKLREYAGDPLLWLAGLGVVVAWRRGLRSWAWGGAYLVLFLAAQAAVGHEDTAGSGLLNERMAQVPAVAVCALAGLAAGMAQQAGEQRARGWLAPLGTCVLLAWLGAGWLQRTRALVKEANQDPSLQLAFEVARLAERQLSPAGRLGVAAPAPAAAAVETYFRKLALSGGDLERARQIVREALPPDLARIRAHLARPPGSVVLAGREPAELMAVFDDAPGAELHRTGAPLARFVHGARAVTVYRR